MEAVPQVSNDFVEKTVWLKKRFLEDCRLEQFDFLTSNSLLILF